MKIQSRPPEETGPAAYTMEQLLAMGTELTQDYDRYQHPAIIIGMLGALKLLGHINDCIVYAGQQNGYTTAYVKLNNSQDIQGFTI